MTIKVLGVIVRSFACLHRNRGRVTSLVAAGQYATKYPLPACKRTLRLIALLSESGNVNESQLALPLSKATHLPAGSESGFVL